MVSLLARMVCGIIFSVVSVAQAQEAVGRRAFRTPVAGARAPLYCEAAPKEKRPQICSALQSSKAWTVTQSTNYIQSCGENCESMRVVGRSEWGAAQTTGLCTPEQERKLKVLNTKKLTQEKALCFEDDTKKYNSIRNWLKSNPDPKCIPRLQQAPQTIVIHHTADFGVNGGTELKEIQRYHMQSQDWADIGYHFVISPDKKGNWQVHEGRKRLPGKCSFLQGAHAGRGMNADSIGIAIVGNYQDSKPSFADPRSATRKTPPPEAQRRLVQLVAKLKADCPTIQDVVGHSAFKMKKLGCVAGQGKACQKCMTACPGSGCQHLPPNLAGRILRGSK